MKNNTIVGVGLIGFGNAGRLYHAPFIASTPGLKLVKVRTSQILPAHVRQVLPAYTTIVDQTESIINDPAIELVVVATPNHLHFDIAQAALAAGKHVVIDKPFTVSTQEADALIATAERHQRVLTVYHNRRLSSDFRTVAKVCSSGLLGRIVEYEAHFDRFRNTIRKDSWKERDLPGAGVFYDMGPHLLDQALQLFGMPDELRADLRIQRSESPTNDSFEVVLLYPNLKVTLKGSMLAKDPFPQFAIYGEQGSFVKYGRDIQDDSLRIGQTPATHTDWGMEPEHFWGRLNTNAHGLELMATVKSERGDYGDFYRNLHQVVMGEGRLLVTAQEARDVIYLLELAGHSSAQKRTLSVEPRQLRVVAVQHDGAQKRTVPIESVVRPIPSY